MKELEEEKYDKLIEICPPFKSLEVSFDRFLHVFSIVQSQIVSVSKPDDEEKQLMLIPIGHLIFNQSSSEPNATVQIEEGDVIFRSTESISAE